MEVYPVAQSGADQRAESAARGSEYALLSRRVRQAGLLDRRLRYYAWKIAFTSLAFAAGWAAFAILGNSWWQVGTAVFLAVVFAQFGFLGHDAGHRQVFRSRRANYLLGVLCGNLATGLSYGWWTGKHNRHHAHPNTEGADPDIMISVLAFSGRPWPALLPGHPARVVRPGTAPPQRHRQAHPADSGHRGSRGARPALTGRSPPAAAQPHLVSSASSCESSTVAIRTEESLHP